MRRLRLSTRIALLFSVVSSLVLILTGFLISFSLYLTIERDAHAFFTKKSASILTDFLTITQGQIYYTSGPDGQSLSSQLRNDDLSAIVLDAKLQPLNTFGIYRNTTSLAEPKLLSQVLATQTPIYRDITLPTNQTFDTYTFVIPGKVAPAGIMQLAKETFWITKLLNSAVTIILTILPISILVNLLLASAVVGHTLRPLNRLVYHLRSLDQPAKINLESSSAEVNTLVNSFNELSDRISDHLAREKLFIANASHELKTPLTRVISTLDLGLVEKKSPSKYLLGAKTELLNLNTLLNELLTHSSLDFHKNQIKPLHLKSFIKSAMGLNPTKLHFVVSCPDNLLILASSTHLSMLVTNLLTNAIKHNRPGGSVTIKVTTSPKITLSISNTGPGLTKHELKRIWDPFYRSPVSHNSPGFGLGLAIVKKICDLQHLQLSITSKPNSLTTISVSGFSRAPIG